MGVVAFAASAFGVNWTEYDAGPFKVIGDSGDRAARVRLGELEQLRHTLGAYLGKDELTTVWPITIVMFANQRDYAPHALPQPLVEGPDSDVGAWSADTPFPPDLLREIARRLIDDNSERMPPWIEQALCDLMATIRVEKNNRISLGTPPPAGELSPERMRGFAKIHMLAGSADYNTKLRVYVNNLQQAGDEASASSNAFGMDLAELDKRAAAYLAAGNFGPVPLAGTPVILDRDFDEMKLTPDAANKWLAALEAKGGDFPEDSPRWLMKKGTREALEDAAKANTKWAEPHAALAKFHADPESRVKELKIATSLEPRNSDFWQDLAWAQEDAGQYPDADKSWKMAERNAANEQDRASYHKSRVGLEQREVQVAIEERQHKATVDADDLERVRKDAEARIHAAEAAANKSAGAVTPGTKVYSWWNGDEGQKLEGSLINVECLPGAAMKLTVQTAAGPAVKLMIRDMQDVAVTAEKSENRFACGAQKPARHVTVYHDGKPDSAQGTAGEVHSVKLP